MTFLEKIDVQLLAHALRGYDSARREADLDRVVHYAMLITDLQRELDLVLVHEHDLRAAMEEAATSACERVGLLLATPVA